MFLLVTKLKVSVVTSRLKVSVFKTFKICKNTIHTRKKILHMVSFISSKVSFGFILKPFSVNSDDAPSEQFEIQILHGKFHRIWFFRIHTGRDSF